MGLRVVAQRQRIVRHALAVQLDATTADGQQYRMDEVSWQTWRDGKIVHERYIYDTATLARTAA